MATKKIDELAERELLSEILFAIRRGDDEARRIAIYDKLPFILMVRDPHKRVQEATSVLLRIKVIFLGYLRQIHQIDATFKHEFIEGGRDFGQKDVEQTTRLINEVMNTTMVSISQNLPIRKTEKLAVDETLKKWQESVKPIVETVTKGEEAKKETNEKDSEDNQGRD